MPISVCIDFETADNGADSACAIGMARISNDAVTDVFYSLIRPPRKRMLYTWVHGLTWNDVESAPTFSEAWPAINAFMAGADFLIAHNAGFDRRVLYACCVSAGIDPPLAPFLCTLKGSRKALRLPSHRLNALCEHFQIELNHHHAESDAIAAAQIMLRLRTLGVEDQVMLLK